MLSSRQLPFATALLVLLSLTGSVAAEEAADTDAKEKSAASPIPTDELQSGCFYSRDVSNWDVLNREYLLIYAPRKSRAYLMRISPPSVELRSATQLAFSGRERICGLAGERLLLGNSSGRSYSIMDVWRVPEEQVDRYTESKRLREDTVIAPRKSPGAAAETDITPNDN